MAAERVKEPVVLRFAVRGNLSLLLGRPLQDLFRKSHFLVFRFEGLDLAVNPMLAGRFRVWPQPETRTRAPSPSPSASATASSGTSTTRRWARPT